VAAPAGTPPEIVQKLSDELVKASKSPDVIKRIRDAGASELGGSSEDLAKHMAAENIKWKKVIEAAKLEPQ
jgi:tripartite-type tricarboxylate transporter receptor subunit TctC